MVAIIVGVVVIQLVALFPPYVSAQRAESAAFQWIGSRPPHVVFQWIGSSPPQRLGRVAVQETVRRVVSQHRWSKMLPPDYTEHIDSRGNRTVRELPPQYENARVTRWTTIAVSSQRSTLALTVSIGFAFALTVAAVYLLRDREPAS